MLQAILLLSAAAALGQSPETLPASRPSLLFTPAEVAALRQAFADAAKPRTQLQAEAPTAAGPALPNIYVSAVAEFGSGQWTVWANGYRIVPGRQPPDFQVLSVRDDSVEIVFPGTPPSRFVLHPHQTWLGRSDSIVEGIFP